jgi:hypothetical protein
VWQHSVFLWPPGALRTRRNNKRPVFAAISFLQSARCLAAFRRARSVWNRDSWLVGICLEALVGFEKRCCFCFDPCKVLLHNRR